MTLVCTCACWDRAIAPPAVEATCAATMPPRPPKPPKLPAMPSALPSTAELAWALIAVSQAFAAEAA